jgi:hypothetical protein
MSRSGPIVTRSLASVESTSSVSVPGFSGLPCVNWPAGATPGRCACSTSPRVAVMSCAASSGGPGAQASNWKSTASIAALSPSRPPLQRPGGRVCRPGSRLFLHHLEEQDVVGLLQRMRESAALAVLANDLVRSRVGYWLAWWGCRALTRSSIVHVDGPRSVEGAFTLDEARDMASRAGLTGLRLTRHWPERFLLRWDRT